MSKRLLLLLLAVIAPLAWAQKADPALLASIRGIRAIDNHAHPPRIVAPGEIDTDYDALPCDPIEPTPPTLPSRPENPQFLAAWKALYGYPYNDMSPAHVAWLMATKARVEKAQGDNYLNWVLDRLNIETELANRVALGRGLQPPHFRWVAFADPLLVPLATGQMGAVTPDRKYFYARESQLLQRYVKQIGRNGLPPTLAEYVSQIVVPTIEYQKAHGAVAVKFEAAYLRSLDFEPEARDDAARIYADGIHGAAPSNAAYLRLQNYIFRSIAAEAGRLGLPVHLHTGYGCGVYFNIAGANPALLESVLDDPGLRGTNFVLLHGGAGPYSKVVAALLDKPNVYTDFSEQTWLLSTRELSKTIRYWLEWYPEKVMFGTDSFASTPQIGWPEVAWQTTDSGRQALAIALTGMMDDGEITRPRALEIARMVLRGNAIKLYGWK